MRLASGSYFQDTFKTKTNLKTLILIQLTIHSGSYYEWANGFGIEFDWLERLIFCRAYSDICTTIAGF